MSYDALSIAPATDEQGRVVDDWTQQIVYMPLTQLLFYEGIKKDHEALKMRNYERDLELNRLRDENTRLNARLRSEEVE